MKTQKITFISLARESITLFFNNFWTIISFYALASIIFAPLFIISLALPASIGSFFVTRTLTTGILSLSPLTIFIISIAFLLFIIAAFFIITIAKGATISFWRSVIHDKPKIWSPIKTAFQNTLPLAGAYWAYIARIIFYTLPFTILIIILLIFTTPLANLSSLILTSNPDPSALLDLLFSAIPVIFTIVAMTTIIIWLQIRWLFTLQTNIYSNKLKSNAVTASDALTHGHKWQILHYAIMIEIISITISFLGGGLQPQTVGNIASTIASSMMIIISIIIAIITSAGINILYTKISSKK